MNDRVSWGNQFVLNYDVIANQHHELVDGCIDLIESIESSISESSIKKKLSDSGEKAIIHFKTEEAVMKEIEYPLLDYHKKQHDLFLSYFSPIVEEVTAPSLRKIFRMFKVQVFLHQQCRE